MGDANIKHFNTHKASARVPTVTLLHVCIKQVTEARGFGLLGEYFNNRWTFGEPVVTRVDAKVDFSWSNTDTLTPTGQDYISVRSV